MNHARIKIKNSGFNKAAITSRVFPVHRLGEVRASNVGGGVLYGYFQMGDNGSIWLNRSLRDHWIATDHAVLAVFIQILLRVEWQDDKKKVYFNGSEVAIHRGQMTCGRLQMCQWACVTPQNYRTAITKLKSTHTITIKSTNKFSIISLVNWNKYQSLNSKSTSKSTNEQHAANTQLTTLEEGKKLRTKEKILSSFHFKGCKCPKCNR